MGYTVKCIKDVTDTVGITIFTQGEKYSAYINDDGAIIAINNYNNRHEIGDTNNDDDAFFYEHFEVFKGGIV